MKKRIFTIVTALTLAFAMLTGCGDTSKNDRRDDTKETRSVSNDDDDDDEKNDTPTFSKKDYRDEAKGISNLLNADDSDIDDAFKDLDVKTPEGKDVKKALKKFINIYEELGDSDLEDLDEDDLKEVKEIVEDLSDVLDNFVDAAEDAGVDKDDLKTVKDYMESMSDGLDNIDDILNSANDVDDDEDDFEPEYNNTAKNNYLDDIMELSRLEDADISDDPEEMADDLNYILKGLEVKTPEGRAIKKDLQDMVDILDMMVKNMDYLDEDAAEEMYNDLLAIYDELEAHLNDFIEAAEDAGVDDDDFEDLDFNF